jgi:prepilin-type processing-associated H-X9-DG protein
MNARHRQRNEVAITLLEVIVTIVVVVLFAVLVLPAIVRRLNRSSKTNCVNNLKNVGLAFRVWSTDNGGSVPWTVTTNQGGTAEVIQDAEHLWMQFVVISNELSTPKILHCPNDSERIPATNFTKLANTNLSYFVGLGATEDNPKSILSGDRNWMTSRVPVLPGQLVLSTNVNFGFSKKIHQTGGNILMGDGSVQQVSSSYLQSVVNAAVLSTNAVNRLLIP